MIVTTTKATKPQEQQQQQQQPYPDISGNVVDVWHSVAESDPGSVQIQDSPLRLDSVGRQERLDGFGHVDRRGRQPRRHLLD